MSVRKKKWRIKNTDQSLDLKQKLLVNRNLLSKEEIQAFMDFDKQDGLHDPYLMKGMKKAVERLLAAIDNNEKVIVFGDYDVDGITGAAVLIHTLTKLGATVSYRIPHRVEDGYGLNMKFVDEFIQAGIDLVITVDCGISCKEEVSKLQAAGVDVIVTDHHHVPDTPPEDAVAIVHPLQSDCDYPFKGLTGVAVAFKVCQALINERLSEPENQKLIESLLDLTSMGTVADCGPLMGENRYIVKKGLEQLSDTSWPGLKLLMEKSKLNFDKPFGTVDIGFKLGPRINASGRISSPYYALQLLLQKDRSHKAIQLADKLETINKERQNMLQEALMEAKENLKVNDTMVIAGWHQDWHPGILGLIAGRLNNEYGKPAFIMQDQGDHLVGSARSNEFFNVVEALTAGAEFLNNFGGHNQAAGFDLKKDNLEGFVTHLNQYADNQLAGVDVTPILDIECDIAESDVNWDTLGLLDQLGPYGTANEQPIFQISNLAVSEVRRVGNDKKHLSFSTTINGDKIKAIGFQMGDFSDYVNKKGSIDVACHLQNNHWKGKDYLQLLIVDLK